MFAYLTIYQVFLEVFAVDLALEIRRAIGIPPLLARRDIPASLHDGKA